MSTKFSKPTAEQRALLKRIIKDIDMREAIATHIGRDENTIRQWAAYRPWCLFDNPAAIEKANEYIIANPILKKTTV